MPLELLQFLLSVAVAVAGVMLTLVTTVAAAAKEAL